MVVCGRGPEQLLLPWRALGSYAAATTTTESTVWQPTFGSSIATSAAAVAAANASIISNNNNNSNSSMKRHLSDSDDIDDVFDDTSSKGTPTQSNDSCQLMNRKKRRGIIEKRRRDRINSSLTELRRLVPTAFEKQGSAKLEKAEILQMTVDHLKMLHAKGFDTFSFDPHKFATDYHNIGFRECAAEVARYLVTVEGMDIQDPLRLRLMSHLQCYSAQRELAAKQATTWNAFSSAPPPPPPAPTSTNSSQYPSSAATAPMMASGQPSHNTHSHHSHPNHHHHHHQGNGNNVIGGVDHSQNMSSGGGGGVHHPLSSLSCSEHPRLSEGGSSGGSTSGLSSHMRFGPTPPASTGSLQPVPTIPVGVTSSSPMVHHPIGHQMHSMHSQYPVSININTHGFTSMSPSSYSPTSTTSQAGYSVKPYRPWGTELAY